jgi:hypothetical protein
MESDGGAALSLAPRSRGEGKARKKAGKEKRRAVVPRGASSLEGW